MDTDLLTDNLALSYLSSSLADLTDSLIPDDNLTSNQSLPAHQPKSSSNSRPTLHIPVFTTASSSVPTQV